VGGPGRAPHQRHRPTARRIIDLVWTTQVARPARWLGGESASNYLMSNRDGSNETRSLLGHLSLHRAAASSYCQRGSRGTIPPANNPPVTLNHIKYIYLFIRAFNYKTVKLLTKS